ncbi:endonuclease/exonuclease/phosphatase family protein [Falsiroseomonas sp.]|jgi:endonuclease/exonuclease/phosphatase family metal-dependent hydrolase|uniref:endonuclease/exonuclease/phosphatase family protein n=1 Tax=Falsiroseomonas sp. TaxID=2870721 RepID=UPI003F706363
MRVATWNIHRGRAAFGRFRPDRIAAVVAEIAPDLMALQEAQHHLRRRAAMLDLAAIEAATGLVPLRVDPLQQGWRGNVLLVRRDARLLSAPRGLRLGGWEPRGGIQADLDLGFGPFRLLCAHLSLGPARRRAQATALLAAIRPGLPVLLMGDLNEWRPGGSALAVLAPAFGHPAGVPSFPAFRPLLALDHILSHPRGLVTGVAAHATPAARRASDHLPLVARFTPSG